VPHVQYSCYIRRGDDDGIWFFGGINRGIEQFIFHPEFVPF